MAYRHDMLHAGLSVVEVLGGEEQRDAKSCNDWNHELCQDLSYNAVCSGFPSHDQEVVSLFGATKENLVV